MHVAVCMLLYACCCMHVAVCMLLYACCCMHVFTGMCMCGGKGGGLCGESVDGVSECIHMHRE